MNRVHIWQIEGLEQTRYVCEQCRLELGEINDFTNFDKVRDFLYAKCDVSGIRCEVCTLPFELSRRWECMYILVNPPKKGLIEDLTDIRDNVDLAVDHLWVKFAEEFDAVSKCDVIRHDDEGGFFTSMTIFALDCLEYVSTNAVFSLVTISNHILVESGRWNIKRQLSVREEDAHSPH